MTRVTIESSVSEWLNSLSCRRTRQYGVVVLAVLVRAPVAGAGAGVWADDARGRSGEARAGTFGWASNPHLVDA